MRFDLDNAPLGPLSRPQALDRLAAAGVGRLMPTGDGPRHAVAVTVGVAANGTIELRVLDGEGRLVGGRLARLTANGFEPDGRRWTVTVIGALTSERSLTRGTGRVRMTPTLITGERAGATPAAPINQRR